MATLEELKRDLKRQGYKFTVHRINELTTTQQITLSAPGVDNMGEAVRWTCPSDKMAVFVGLDLTEGDRSKADPAYFYFGSGSAETALSDPIAFSKESIFGTQDVGVGHYKEVQEEQDFNKMFRFDETIMLQGGESIVVNVKPTYGVEQAKTRLMMRCHLFYKG